MITVHNVHKNFSSGGNKVHALAGVSLEVSPGQLVAIIGKSGSGKSTLLALLGALDSPTSGEILVDGADVSKLHGRQLLNYRRSTIGFIFQNYNLIPNLSALENVMLPMEFAGKSSTERKKRATHLLNQVGLTGDKLHRTPGRLSGGEQQRVAIARALANKPKLVLADEPTGNLDSTTGLHIVELLRSLARSEKTTVINVTHDLEIAKHADVTLHLQDGKLTHENAVR